MPQQHGLGRGLASLIPPKKTTGDSPFKDMVMKTMTAQGVSLDPVSPVTSVHDDSLMPPPSLSMNDAPSQDAVRSIPIASIVPNPHQPRFVFDEAKLQELAQSIKEHGVIQPLIVSPKDDGGYEIIAGERRFQASKLAGLTEVPVIIRAVAEQEKLELAIIENIQRHDLNPIEEAKAYQKLLDEFNLHQDDVAKKMGKSRSVVANMIRLLSLPVEVQRALGEGKITTGHAKALLSIENDEQRRALFELMMKTGMTVRDAEAKAREVSVRPHTRRVSVLPPELVEKIDRMSASLGTKVMIKPVGKGGRIVLEYYSPEEFDGLWHRLVDTDATTS